MKLINSEMNVVAEGKTVQYDTRMCAWDVDGALYSDAEKSLSIAPESLTPTPVQFMLMFAPAERVAMKAARATDPVLDDFFDIVDDPRLTYVDLGLQSTKDAVAYLVSKSLITEARAVEILAGVLK